MIKINGSRDTLIVKKGNQNIFTMFMLSWDGQGATSCEINHYQNPDATPKLVYEGISNNGVEIKGPFAESGSYSLSCKVTNDPEEAAFLTYVSYIVEE